ncbi:MAG TPA: hypothetical protein GXX75_26245 [Clostridiales bacterium]|nr:hypothetical protein [Clostridiales bacterium]
MKNNKATPSKTGGAKNNDSNNDVDYKNSNSSRDKVNSTTSNKSSSKGSK